MQKVRVAMYIHAPIARVFDAVSDHELFLTVPGKVATRIVTPGIPHRNGLGCKREVRVDRFLRYLEEITVWEPPDAFEYVIRQCSVPIRHDAGRLAFRSQGAGTEIEWTTRFEFPIPGFPWLFGSATERRVASAFTELLVAARTRLEKSSA